MYNNAIPQILGLLEFLFQTICKKNPVLPSLALFSTLILALTPWISAPTILICPIQHIELTSFQMYVIPGLPPLPLVHLIIIHLYLVVQFTLFHLVLHFFVYFSLSWVACLISRPFPASFPFILLPRLLSHSWICFLVLSLLAQFPLLWFSSCLVLR